MGEIVACLRCLRSRADPCRLTARPPQRLPYPAHGGRYQGHPARNFKLMVDELGRFFGGHETRYDLTPWTLANRTGQAPGPR